MNYQQRLIKNNMKVSFWVKLYAVDFRKDRGINFHQLTHRIY